MSEYFSHTPVASKHLQIFKFALKLSLSMSLSFLFWLGSSTPSTAAILTSIKFEWTYDISIPGLMGYMIYQENQPIITINDPFILATDFDVYLETGQQNSFTITAYDNLGNESNPSPPYIVDVPQEEASGNVPPVAHIEISSLSGPAPLNVDVSASKSIDYDGVIISYAWNFGDGGFSIYENEFHTYDIPGSYTVILEVTDDAGSISTTETTVTVTDPQIIPNEPPTPSIHTTTNSGPAPLDVLFDGTDSTDSDGTIVDYSWDFGDGSSGNGIFTNYTYTIIGTFTGQLTVTDDAGASASDQTVISVAASDPLNKPPVAVINASPLTGDTPLTTTFSGTNSTDLDGVIISYEWDFGDGSVANGTDATHQYIAAATYTANLTVTDDMGDTNQAQITITASDEILPTTVLYTDDFSTDTSSSYTNINGTLSVANGAAHGSNWQTTVSLHNLSLGSNDHWVEAEVAYNGISDSAGLIGRVDPTGQTGYTAYFTAGKINLNRFSGTAQTWLASVNGPYNKGTYALRMVIAGSAIKVYVDGALKINKVDTTYNQGLHAGLRIYRGNANVDVTTDNLKAGIGSPPPLPQQNTAPVAKNTSFTTTEDTAVSGTFIVSDLNGDPLTTSIINNGILGNVTITDPLRGTYSYTPNANVSGSDTFTFKANDGLADSNVATATISITPVNDPPVTQTDMATTNEDESVLINVLKNDTDIDVDLLNITSVGQPVHGTATISNNQVLYTPAANYHGPDSFSYQISDNRGGNAAGMVEMTIIPVNDPPTANAGTMTLQANTPGTGTLTANDPDGDPLTFSIVTNGILGTAILTNSATGEYIYTPNKNVSGADTFTFKVNDGTTDSNIATFTIIIKNPTVSDLNDDFSTDTTINYENINGKISIYNGAAHGSNWQTTIASHKTPLDLSDHWVEADLEYNGISDSAGLLARVDATKQTGYSVYFSAGRINLISFYGTNQTWLALYDGSYSADTYSVRLIVTGSTIKVFVNGVLRIEKINTTYLNGSNIGLRINRGYTNADVTVDNLRAGSEPPPPFLQQNNPPVAQNTHITIDEDTQGSSTFTVSDPDGDQLTAEIITNGSLGTAVITDPLAGSYSYTPTANITGIDTFTFKVNDGIFDSNIGTVTVTITAVNDVPIATDDIVILYEDQSTSINVLTNDTDIDKDSLNITSIDQPANGNVSTILNNIICIPNSNYFGPDSFSYTISDPAGATASATVWLTILKVNDPPVATGGKMTTPENSSANGLLTSNDIENDPLTYTLIDNGTLGTATITNLTTGAYIYTPNINVSGTDTFSFKVNDTKADSNIATVTVTIEPPTATSFIADDFTINSGADYTSISGLLTVRQEAAHGQDWRRTVAYHNTELASADHWAEAEVKYSGLSDTGGVIACVDDSLATGYAAYFSAGRINLAKFEGITQTWLALHDGGYSEGIYTVKISAHSNIIEVYVNGDLKIQRIDSSYQGKRVGLYLYRGSKNTDITADNFRADILKE